MAQLMFTQYKMIIISKYCKIKYLESIHIESYVPLRSAYILLVLTKGFNLKPWDGTGGHTVKIREI